ncbi:MAG TPA: carboxymuconolactone decarboxylase family protein [Candidatus Dormibacteraeota bacterium]
MANSEKYEAGMKVRREVLGEEHVNASMASATGIQAWMQELTTEMAWGTIWTRPGLPRKTRSLLVIGMLTALGKTPELKLHLRGALRNGCTEEEIGEALLQAAVYAGIPAGIEAFRAAREVFAERA